jgi:hypothetical protein
MTPDRNGGVISKSLNKSLQTFEERDKPNIRSSKILFPPNSDDILYEKFLAFINNSQYIRLGSSESIRTTELAEEFNRVTMENISHISKLPQLMKRLIMNNANFGIIKKVRNNGTIYIGIGLTRFNSDKQKRPPLTQKEKDEKRAVRNRALSNRFKLEICNETEWTEIQYQQLVNLGLVCLIHENNILNMEATIFMTKAKIAQYVYNSITKLKRAERTAKIIMNDFNTTKLQDVTLTICTDAPIYTNRLKAAERTYTAGSELERKVNTYINTVEILPKISFISYPNIDELLNLIHTLKENSLFKTRQDMKITQEQYETDATNCVNWTIDNILDMYTGDYAQFT